MKLYAALLLSLTFTHISLADNLTDQQGELEDACEMALQGKVAWDHEGNSEWADSQILKLCGNAQRSIQPAVCFNKLMTGEMPQGNGFPWEWYNAIKLCKQTLNAQQTLDCYTSKIRLQGQHEWKQAMNECNAVVSTSPIYAQVPEKQVEKPVSNNVAVTHEEKPLEKKPAVVKKVTPEKAVATLVETSTGEAKAPVELSTFCMDQFQGKIAWNYGGRTDWNPNNLKRLCKDVEDSDQPAQCFNTAMHGGLNWGQGTNWEWPNALHLCEGVKNAEVTISCFREKIAAGKKWKPAIAACHEVGIRSKPL